MLRELIVNVLASLIYDLCKSLFDTEPIYEVVGIVLTTVSKQVHKAVKATLRAAFTFFG